MSLYSHIHLTFGKEAKMTSEDRTASPTNIAHHTQKNETRTISCTLNKILPDSCLEFLPLFPSMDCVSGYVTQIKPLLPCTFGLGIYYRNRHQIDMFLF